MRKPQLGRRQIILDCEVLQADGGTRTASLTGAYAALAIRKLSAAGMVDRSGRPASAGEDGQRRRRAWAVTQHALVRFFR